MSWDQRIARAQKLSKANPSAREILELYLKVASFQKSISRSLNGAEHADVHSLLQFLPQLRTLINNLGSPQLQEKAAKLGDDQERWSELLLQHWEQDPAVQIEDPAQAFCAYVLLQPYAQHVTSRMNISSVNTATQCPACGNPPQLSLLRDFNNGAKRSLVCSLCSTEWEFRRVLCPDCGEQHKDKLPVFTAEEFEQARIEACDTCKSYVKCIDLSKDGNAVPTVDDLATLAIDLWAQEQGYTRHCPNMFMLELP
jgi:FdhE protein